MSAHSVWLSHRSYARSGVAPHTMAQPFNCWKYLAHLTMGSSRFYLLHKLQNLTTWQQHRHMSQGAGGLQPPESGKTIIFRAEASSQNEKKILNEKKRNSFCPVTWSAQNLGFLLIIIRWGESGKQLCSLCRLAWRLFGELLQYFSGKDGSAS